MFIDSHCHLQLIDYSQLGSSMEEVVQLAVNNQIQHMLCVATHIDQDSTLKSIADNFKEVSISIGMHPNETIASIPRGEITSREKIVGEPTVEDLLAYQQHPKVVAIGETGMDSYRNDSQHWQQQRFVNHITAAKICKKPLIIHSRAAKKATIDILTAENARDIGGVLHCFTEDWEMAKQVLDLNFYISFSGIVTFKNAKDLQDVAKKVPLDRMLIETDAPYLAPTPHRGKINQPAYVRHVGEFLAALKGVNVEHVADITSRNYQSLFAVQ